MQYSTRTVENRGRGSAQFFCLLSSRTHAFTHSPPPLRCNQMHMSCVAAWSSSGSHVDVVPVSSPFSPHGGNVTDRTTSSLENSARTRHQNSWDPQPVLYAGACARSLLRWQLISSFCRRMMSSQLSHRAVEFYELFPRTFYELFPR
jgi:hypothetical protein